MEEKEPVHVEIDGVSVHVDGDKGESVRVGPGGIHIQDGDSDVRVGWTGIRIRDGESRVNISCLKPLIGCGLAAIVFIGILTAVIVGIVKLLM